MRRAETNATQSAARLVVVETLGEALNAPCLSRTPEALGGSPQLPRCEVSVGWAGAPALAAHAREGAGVRAAGVAPE